MGFFRSLRDKYQQALESLSHPPGIKKTKYDLGETPEFRGITQATNPTLVNNPSIRTNTGDKQVGGLYYPGGNKIVVARIPGNMAAEQKTLIHEGLHARWEKMNSKEREDFLRLASQTATPDERKYVGSQLKGDLYGAKDTPQDFSQYGENLQTEVHSYLGDFSQTPRPPKAQVNLSNSFSEEADGTPVQYSPELKNYYRRYYNPDRPNIRPDVRQIGMAAGVPIDRLERIRRALGR